MHKTNSFLRHNFQFVSISKQNVWFYSYVTVIERKIKTVSIKNIKKKTKPERNETNFLFKVKNELFSILKKQNIDIPRKKTNFRHEKLFKMDIKRQKIQF
jgi:hypothetical protein